MNIYVLDKQLNIVNVIDNYTSIIWTNRYYECGDFELYLSATPSLIRTLREDYYLLREGKEENAMIIETIQINTDEEEGNHIVVSGRCLKSILYRRIIWQQTQVNDFIENCITTLINENVISPSDGDRKISNLSLGYLIQTNTKLNTQYTGDNLGETITSICQSHGLGWNISLDLDNKKFIFSLYSGVDRSYNQDKKPWVIFSNEYDNLLSSEYIFSKTEYANVVKVAGEGEGLARKNTVIGNATGIDRYETYADARDVSSNDGEISEEEYYSQLAEKGNEKLAETVKTESFSGEVVEYQYTYDKDYSLGDIVEVVNEYGMSAVSRIIEVIKSEDEAGIYIIPTFSAWEGFVIEEPEQTRDELLFVPPPIIIEPEPTYVNARFTGREFNRAIKTLINSSATYDTRDYTITRIEFTEIPPAEGVAYNTLVENDSGTQEGYTLQAYLDGSVAKLYTNADKVKLSWDMYAMFYEFRVLQTLDLSKFDTTDVKIMNYMFNNCYELTSLDVSNFDTSNVTEMNDMFNCCKKLTQLDLSNFNTSNVKYMQSLFGYCESLTSLDVSNFDTSNVLIMIGMFYSCKKITQLDLSNFNTKSVTSADKMFYNTINLEQILVTQGLWDLSNALQYNIFVGCKCSGVTYV